MKCLAVVYVKLGFLTSIMGETTTTAKVSLLLIVNCFIFHLFSLWQWLGGTFNLIFVHVIFFFYFIFFQALFRSVYRPKYSIFN